MERIDNDSQVCNLTYETVLHVAYYLLNNLVLIKCKWLFKHYHDYHIISDKQCVESADRAQQHSDVRMSYRIFLLWIFNLKHLYILKTFLTQITRLQTNLPVLNSLFLQLQGPRLLCSPEVKLRIVTECKLALIFHI